MRQTVLNRNGTEYSFIKLQIINYHKKNGAHSSRFLMILAFLLFDFVAPEILLGFGE